MSDIKIKSKNLNVYYGDKQALFDVNLELNEKEVTVNQDGKEHHNSHNGRLRFPIASKPFNENRGYPNDGQSGHKASNRQHTAC